MNTTLLHYETEIVESRKAEESRVDAEAAAIRAARQGDLEAFNDLVSSYQDSVYRQAFYLMKERQAAEDIAQEAFMTAFRKLDTFRGGSFRAWLLRITKNLCYDELRRRKRRTIIPLEIKNRQDEIIESPSWLTSKAETPEAAAERTELRSVLQQAISKLPDKLREAVILVDLQGLKYVEAAQVSNVSIGTIKSRLARGRASLRTDLCAPSQPVSKSYCQFAFQV
jgi:RNA polymerase sigma factor (sigma-70 family)